MSGNVAFNWATAQLVVFDIDGTLYNQRALRLQMAKQLALHTLFSFNLRTLKVLNAYRGLRERLAEEDCESFEARLLDDTMAATGVPTAVVQSIVDDWMLKRPLPHLRDCRYRGLDEVFAGLRRNGKTIGIFSDYPSHEKLAALGLAADFIVSAADSAVGRLKPHPLGLQVVMELAGCSPEQTVLIGDRIERDGLAAQRAGCRGLIRTSRPIKGWQCFTSFDEPLFAPILI